MLDFDDFNSTPATISRSNNGPNKVTDCSDDLLTMTFDIPDIGDISLDDTPKHNAIYDHDVGCSETVSTYDHENGDTISYSDEDDDFGGSGCDMIEKDIDLDAVIAKAMHSLSPEERRQALHDIHGVAEVEDDDPHVIASKLAEMELELSKIHHKPAYIMALTAAPTYVCDADFRLLFLRSDDMNPQNAARRMVRHFETKLELFGPQLLGRDIRTIDLNADDMVVLESGYAQWLNQRDRAGRAVLFWTPGAHVGPMINRLRVQWYGFMNALRDVETQKRGMVGVGYSIGNTMGRYDPQAALRLPMLARSLPTRFVAVHTCTEGPHPVLDVVMRGIGSFFQVRYRAHYGTPSECLYSLMTFGIPSNAFPLNADGTVKTKEHAIRIKKRVKQEQDHQKISKDVVFIPGQFDVLLGRGKLSQENLGNLRYRMLIASYQERYEKATKVEKTAIADEVVQAVKKFNGRFLAEYYSDYAEISYAKAREKVSHSFRSLRVKTLHQQRQNSQETHCVSDESSAVSVPLSSQQAQNKGSSSEPKKEPMPERTQEQSTKKMRAD